MNNKVLTNFRSHPTLRFDNHQSVFKIENKVYLISEGVVRQIIPQRICQTNIGEPYMNLLYLFYIFADVEPEDSTYGESIYFAPKHEEALRQLLS
jgi:hypothetical protein